MVFKSAKNLSKMITILTIIAALFAAVIAYLQLTKENIEQQEALDKEKEVNAIYKKLQDKSDTIELKSDSIISLQAQLDKKNQELSDFVTGGHNVPNFAIMFNPHILIIGNDGADTTDFYNEIRFVLLNKGKNPIHNVRIRFTDILGKIVNKYQRYTPPGDREYQFEPNITLITPGIDEIFHIARVPEIYDKLHYSFTVVWNTSHYIANMDIEIKNKTLTVTNLSYYSDGKKIPDVEKYFEFGKP